MTQIHIDFETYSEADLKRCGAWSYSEHPSTEVLVMCWAVDGGEPKTWLPAMHPFPRELSELIAAGAELHAWNAQFEIAIWTNNIPERSCPPPSQWRCSMAVAAYCNRPLALGACAASLGIEQGKDKSGRRLIHKFCKPRKATKASDAARVHPHDDLFDFDLLIEYCAQDVRAERATVAALPINRLPDQEQRVWEMDQEVNRRGVRLDLPAVERIAALIDQHTDDIEVRAKSLTGGIGTGRRAAILAWAASRGCHLPGYTKADVSAALERDDLPADVREVLVARQASGSTSLAKFQRMLAATCRDGTSKGLMQYYGATQTGRWAGRLWQVHNMPRGSVDVPPAVAESAATLDLDDYKMLFAQDPTAVFASMIRQMIIPPVGEMFHVADFSKIEVCVLAWIVGQEDQLQQLRDGEDVYKHMASEIFNVRYSAVTKAQRQLGKGAVLGCGYGAGPVGFMRSAPDVPPDLASRVVQAYRGKNNMVVQAWNDVEDAARNAIAAPRRDSIHEVIRCKILVHHDSLIIRLPSGRCLFYPAPRLEGLDISFAGDQYTYGAKLVENIVQAAARDLLVNAMLQIRDAGFNLVASIHDEVVASHPDGDHNAFMRAMVKLPAWTAGCPIEAEGWVGDRYRK